MRLLVIMCLATIVFSYPRKRFPGDNESAVYLVVLKNSANVDDVESHINKINTYASIQIVHVQRRYTYVLKGFQLMISRISALREVISHPDVLHAEKDGKMVAFEAAFNWGQDRVTQRKLPLDGQANFAGTGKGVNAYVLDTGIYVNNTYFNKRAKVAYDSTILHTTSNKKKEGVDKNGHGTHCAGVLGSGRFGIASEVNIYGVKVLHDKGIGFTSDVIDGIEWVAKHHKKPAVASMSLGGLASVTLDLALRGLVKSNVTVVAAAGNYNFDACHFSPAREPMVITVGATEINTNISDQRAPFSNYGWCVDIFAPGKDILSTWIGVEDSTSTVSGTSMACPQVAGAASILLGNEPHLTPAQVKQKLLRQATDHIIEGNKVLTPNKLLYIGDRPEVTTSQLSTYAESEYWMVP